MRERRACEPVCPRCGHQMFKEIFGFSNGRCEMWWACKNASTPHYFFGLPPQQQPPTAVAERGRPEAAIFATNRPPRLYKRRFAITTAVAVAMVACALLWLVWFVPNVVLKLI